MSPKNNLEQERKAQIMEAAIQVFAEKGFDQATMADIVARAGLSKGALYWYFESKEELIIAIVDFIFERELAHVLGRVEAVESAEAKLLTTLELVAGSFEQMKPLIPIFFEYWGMMMREERIRQAIAGYYHDFFEFVRPIIHHGVERGEFHADDVDSVAYSLGALIEGMGILWAADPESIDLERHTHIGMRLLISGLKREK